MAGGAGALSEGFGRASSCWDCTGKKWKENKFPGKRKKEIRAIKNTIFCFFFLDILFALMLLFGWILFLKRNTKTLLMSC